MSVVLSEHLPLLASAPDGIQKLRGLILELAVRGKLVPQNPNDEPASELLKQIVKERVQQEENGTGKKSKPTPPVRKDEQAFELPDGWAWVRFADVTSYIQRGKGPDYADKSDYVVVSQKCVRWHGLDLSQARWITPESFSKYDTIRLLRGGDVLWNSTGTGTIGRAVVVPSLEAGQVLVADSHVTVVRSVLMSPIYLWRWIQSPSVQREIEGSASGSTNQIELATSTVTAHPLPLPPLAEQHRIVAKVDELMALCDRLEAEQADAVGAHARLVETLLGTLTQSTDAADLAANWKRLAEHFDTLFITEASIDALKQTVLQLAVMGKLVPQNVDAEPASGLLKRIEQERARLEMEGVCKKSKPLHPVSDGEFPFEVPASWKWVRIGNYVLHTDYGLSEKTTEMTDGVPILKMGDIQAGEVILGGQKAVPATTEGLPYLFLEPDDLLYNRTNSAELVGKTGIYRGPSQRYSFASYLIRIRCAKQITSPKYLNLVMNSPFFRQTEIVPHLKQQCGQANVNGTILRNMRIPVPPAEEQHRIVAKVEELMALCGRLKADLATARQRQGTLADTLIESALEAA